MNATFDILLWENNLLVNFAARGYETLEAAKSFAREAATHWTADVTILPRDKEGFITLPVYHYNRATNRFRQGDWV